MNAQHGFTLIKEQEIPELNTLAQVYRHSKTGAELLSLQNDDENKVFGISFRTPPPDSTGLPHIMEHAVLCGSTKYPVKEPFVELLKGSLNTFLNAFTSPDKTTYPVASQNLKDFYNLVDVYLDAVFHPRITPQILQQEGWHYELETPDQPLSYKGVVFNEMKGAYSSPDNLLYRQGLRSLFPDTAYGLDSGGDPGHIPDLTYEQFRAFHDTYYHPSNARIFFYGDDDPQKRLRSLDEVLSEFEAIDVDSSIALQAPFAEPIQLTVPYDAGEKENKDYAKKGFVTINWMLAENVDPELTLALGLLEHVLIGTPASPLRKALIDSGLGEDLAGIGLMESVRQMVFSTGLKGISLDDAERVVELVTSTLQSLAEQGIDADTVAASLNTIEFSLRENNTGSYPRGLVLLLRSLSTWLHEGDPLAPLAFEAPLQSIKSRLAQGERLLEDLIQTYLLDNPHRSTLLLKPDPDLGARQHKAEEERLQQARAGMSDERMAQIVRETRELARLQETPDSPEALATIPSLTLDDLDRENIEIPIQVIAEPTPILYHDLFTNGIVYLDLALNVHVLPQDLLPFVPLFGQALVKMGTEMEDFVKLSQRIGQKTGGISPTVFTSSMHQGTECACYLVLRAKSTTEQTTAMLDILRDILLTVQLDNQDRFRQIVLEAKARAETAIIPAGHRVALTRLSAHWNEAGWVKEQMSGISGLFFLRQLAEDVEQDWPSVLSKLQAVRSALIDRSALLCNVTTAADDWPGVQTELQELIGALPETRAETQEWDPVPPPSFEGLTIPARVNYVAKGADLYKAGYNLDGSILVISNYLRTTWLWEKIRVQGGAYGAFCVFDRHDGAWSYLSYRDPNVQDTLDNYDQTARFLGELELSQEELVKSIIGAIGRIDDYQLPDAKGYTSMLRHLLGDTPELRQKLRDQVLSTTQADFAAFAEALQAVSDRGHVVILGSQEAIDESNAQHKGWLQVTQVL